MKATLVKIPAKYIVIMGDGEHLEVEFAATEFKAANVARQYGATDIKVGAFNECLSFTHTERS